MCRRVALDQGLRTDGDADGYADEDAEAAGRLGDDWRRIHSSTAARNGVRAV